MDLIIWRHAEAEDIRAGISDSERKLTAKGKKQARKMAGWLTPRLPQELRILVSPAARTVQTAEALQREFDICDLISPSASLSDHLAAAGWLEDGCVMFVGHQPSLGQLAALLMCGHAYPWEIKKGAAWWLRSLPPGNKPQAMLWAAMVPGLLE